MQFNDIYKYYETKEKIKSMFLELRELESENMYTHANFEKVTRTKSEKSMQECYVLRKEKINKELTKEFEKLEKYEKELNEIINNALYPISCIIRYRIKNKMSYEDIAKRLYMDRRTVARKFDKYIKNI